SGHARRRHGVRAVLSDDGELQPARRSAPAADREPDDALEAARVPVAPGRVTLVRFPPDAAGRIETAGDGDVDHRNALGVVDEDAHALGHRVDRRRRWHRDAALEPHLLAAWNGEPADPDPRLDGEHGDDVRAGIAGVPDAVVVTVRLRGVRGRRTIVERVADAVAVTVRLAGVGRTAWIRACTHLREVTARGCASADRAGGDECVGGTVVADAVAVLRDVASPGRGPAGGCGLRVGRTARAGRV